MADTDIYFHHVADSNYFEMPEFTHGLLFEKHFLLPRIDLLGYHFQITKFMVLQVVALLLTWMIFAGLARHIRSGRPARGRWWNFWETLALYIRDEVVRPSIEEPHSHHDDHAPDHVQGGHEPQGGNGAVPAMAMSSAVHDHLPAYAGNGHVVSHEALSTGAHYADRYLPFIWSVFFYILFCNLLGLLPLLGAATASTSVTGVIAASVLFVTLYSGMKQNGVSGYWSTLVPDMGIKGPGGLVLYGMIWLIEAFGLLIKHAVLAIRLFANMFGGHVVIAVFLFAILNTAHHGVIWYVVTPASVIGQIAVGFLELFVAFLQAYVFALLAAMFIGTAVNPH